MALKHYKATSNGRRNMTGYDFTEITTNKPEKTLLRSQKQNAGRNSQGKITVRHHGGGHKRSYRIIDFKRNKDGVVGTVATIEYDPNRTANIALVHYEDGVKTYILAPRGIKVGQKIESGPDADIQVGNEQHELSNIGKAGRNRWLSKRPTVRGSVMNPNDHPHGGGEGKAPVGRPSPMTPWGKPARGIKTRDKNARSNKLIVRRRNSK